MLDWSVYLPTLPSQIKALVLSPTHQAVARCSQPLPALRLERNQCRLWKFCIRQLNLNSIKQIKQQAVPQPTVQLQPASVGVSACLPNSIW